MHSHFNGCNICEYIRFETSISFASFLNKISFDNTFEDLFGPVIIKRLVSLLQQSSLRATYSGIYLFCKSFTVQESSSDSRAATIQSMKRLYWPEQYKSPVPGVYRKFRQNHFVNIYPAPFGWKYKTEIASCDW